jgi:hypothetical protein
MTDRHEKEWPAEVPFRYVFRAGNRRMNVLDRRVPRAVVHRDAIAASADNGAGYAERLLAGTSAGSAAPPRARRPVVTPRPTRTPDQERAAAQRDLDRALAAIEKAKAALAALGK